MKLIDVGRALAAVALAATATAAVPAQAVSAPIAVEHATARTASGETCTPEKDEYSADNGTSVRWSSCFGDHGGPNASFRARCWSKPVAFWSRAECRVEGHFVIRDPQGNQVRGGNFSVYSDRHNDWGSNTFRFSCDERPAGPQRPHGAYTFTTTNTQARLTRYDFQPAKIPDTTVTYTMC